MADVQGEAQLQARLANIRKAPAVMLRTWQMRTTQLAKVLAPKRTGNLKRSIRPGIVTGDSATVVAATNYARFVEEGTRAHTIRPRNRKVLAWNNSPGAYRLSGSLRSGARPNVFAREVHHPGTRPHPFMMPAGEQALGEIGIDAVVKQWNDGA